MICRTSGENQSGRRFRSCVKPYLKVKKHRTMRASTKYRATNPSEIVILPVSDVTHLFNFEAMLAVSHAIEDLALDTGSGELLSTFQHIDNFTPQQERYRILADNLDTVRVWAEGDPPPDTRQIDFIPVFHPAVARYWIVLFNSPDIHAILFCKQANQTSESDQKIFSGFYSFNPFLVRCIHRRFSLLACGVDGVVSHFERHFSPSTPDADSMSDFDSLLASADI